MSLFDDNLVYGFLNDVVKDHNVRILKGHSTQVMIYDNKIGAVSNIGFISFEDIFKHYNGIDSESGVFNCVLKESTIDTMFRPYRKADPIRLTNFGCSFDYSKFDETYISDYEWWEMVRSSFLKGFAKQINEDWVCKVDATFANEPYAYVRRMQISLTILSHKDMGIVYQPVSENGGDELCRLYCSTRGEAKMGFGRPFEIVFVVDLEYIGNKTKDNREV